MSARKIYISGKITGLPLREYQEKFKRQEDELLRACFSAWNPATEVVAKLDMWFYTEDITWKSAMQVCVAQLVYCDGVFAMPCHADSKGAALELHIAKALDIPIFYSMGELLKHKFDD